MFKVLLLGNVLHGCSVIHFSGEVSLHYSPSIDLFHTGNFYGSSVLLPFGFHYSCCHELVLVKCTISFVRNFRSMFPNLVPSSCFRLNLPSAPDSRALEVSCYVFMVVVFFKKCCAKYNLLWVIKVVRKKQCKTNGVTKGLFSKSLA